MPGSERRSEMTAAIAQTTGGILLILFGVAFVTPLPVLLMSSGLKAGGLPAAIIMLTFGLFGGLFGLLLIILGVRMLRSAQFHGSEAPVLRNLRRLSYDAVPVNGYVVGLDRLTHQVLICFDETPADHVALMELAAELSTPEMLEELNGGELFVADRRLRLPNDLTGGRMVYLADIQVTHVVVGGIPRLRRVVSCTAEPGAAGRIAASGY